MNKYTKSNYAAMGAVLLSVAGMGMFSAGCVDPGPTGPVLQPVPTAGQVFGILNFDGSKTPLLDGDEVLNPVAQISLGPISGQDVCISFDGTPASISGGVCGGTSVLLSSLTPPPGAADTVSTCLSTDMGDGMDYGATPPIFAPIFVPRSMSVAFEWDDTINEDLINSVYSINYTQECTFYEYGLVTSTQTIVGGAPGIGTGTGAARIHPVTNVVTLEVDTRSTLSIFGTQKLYTTSQVAIWSSDPTACAAGTLCGVAGQQTVTACSGTAQILCDNANVGVTSYLGVLDGTGLFTITDPIAYDLSPGSIIAFQTVNDGAQADTTMDYEITVLAYPYPHLLP